MEPGDLRGNSNTEGFSGSNLYLLKYIKNLILVGQKYGKGGGGLNTPSLPQILDYPWILKEI